MSLLKLNRRTLATLLVEMRKLNEISHYSEDAEKPHEDADNLLCFALTMIICYVLL